MGKVLSTLKKDNRSGFPVESSNLLNWNQAPDFELDHKQDAGKKREVSYSDPTF